MQYNKWAWSTPWSRVTPAFRKEVLYFCNAFIPSSLTSPHPVEKKVICWFGLVDLDLWNPWLKQRYAIEPKTWKEKFILIWTDLLRPCEGFNPLYLFVLLYDFHWCKKFKNWWRQNRLMARKPNINKLQAQVLSKLIQDM